MCKRESVSSMSMGRNLVILGIWATGMGAWAWWKFVRIDDNLSLPGVESSNPNRKPPAPGVDVTWKWQSESTWLVDQVARDIAEICLFASHPKASAEELASLDVKVESVSHGDTSFLVSASAARAKKDKTSTTLPLSGYLWAPENFVPWAQAIQKGWKATSQKSKQAAETGTSGLELAKKLQEPTSAVLMEESHRLSKELNQAPLDAGLHDQSALLVGALALREAAGAFSDARPALCRMTAHLALARSISPEPTLERELAETILLTLVCRQADALDRIEKLPAELSAWQRALKLRNTSDWRLVEKPGEVTLLERREHARALVTCRDASAVMKTFEETPPADLPDWSRIATEQGFSVGEGHVLANGWLEREIADLAESWKTWSGKDLKTDNLVVILNDPPTRCLGKNQNGKPALEVLGWGFVAASHQRHLCHALDRTQVFLRDMWGVPDAAAGFEKQVLQHFAGMRLLPFALKRIATTEKLYRTAVEDASAICRKQPDLVTCCNWATLRQKGRFTAPATSLPRAQAWFTQELTLGTAYDFRSRYIDLGTLYNASIGFWDKLAATAPYQYDVARSYLYKKHGNSPTIEQFRQAYTKLEEYHLPVMEHISATLKGDPKAYMAYMTRICQLNPDEFIDLGQYLVEKGFKEDAAFAYQAAFEMANDRVSWANHADWLVNYNFDNGRTEDAVKVATAAAEVYSYRGLETMAKLMERMEKWVDASKYYAAIGERYNDNSPLISFLERNQERDPKLAEAYKQALAPAFPDGIQDAVLADFKEAPVDGVEITSSSQLLVRNGMKSGSIIVALDGHRVQTLEQYDLLRSMKPGAPLDLIVWDGSAYRQLSVNVPNRKFGCDMDSYIK